MPIHQEGGITRKMFCHQTVSGWAYKRDLTVFCPGELPVERGWDACLSLRVSAIFLAIKVSLRVARKKMIRRDELCNPQHHEIGLLTFLCRSHTYPSL